ncbi:MAG TPA: HEAT repeat domain-containing protein [Nitrospirota bacterium]|nr:HEAT repeat domain-containing protein [Nitrospirota bacterium]
MPEELRQAEALSPEIQDVMRSLISAIRAVKLYPPNNPIYSQSVKKSYEALSRFLVEAPEYNVGVQKINFTYHHTPIGRDAQLNKAIAQDLYAKGIREIVFSAGLTEQELMDFCRALALSAEELAIKSGISSILWEKTASHIKVTESGLDEVITTIADSRWEATTPATSAAGTQLDKERKKAEVPSKTLVLGDLLSDPSRFGDNMLELAKQTKAEHESVEDRLFTLYQEAGQRIRREQPSHIEALFEGLAKSAISLEQPYREVLIGGKLYGDMDTDLAAEQEPELGNQLPSVLQEIQTGRFSNAWTVQQVASLLKKSSSKKIEPATPPVSAASLVAVPIPGDLDDIARQLSEYSPEEMVELKALGEAGMEKDVVEGAIRTLIHLIPIVKNPQHAEPSEQEINFFSGIIHQLEELLAYLLSKKEYEQAAKIIRAFQIPVDPAFKPRMAEALKKTGSKTTIIAAIGELRKNAKSSSAYENAYAYVSILERETTEVLLELMAEEKDRSARIFYLDLVKDVGRNQITLLGERLLDGRWYFVRNIVSILADNKTDQAIALLRRAADHTNAKIRQEVIKALFSIGGKKSAGILAKFLRDRDEDVQITAIRAFADFPGIGAEESAPLVAYLDGRDLKKKDQELTLEAIKALGRIGGRDAVEFLKSYTRIRWWKPRKLQRELRDAANRSIEEISRRQGNGGRP